MKHTSVLFITFILVLLFAFRMAESIIEQLGLQHRTAQTYILGNIAADFTETSFTYKDDADPFSIDDQLQHFRIPHTRLLPAVINGDQAAAAKALCQYIKDYVNSEEFAAAYQARREAAKPTSEPYRLSPAELASQMEQLKKTEKEMATLKKSGFLSEAQLAEMSKAIASQKAALAKQADPTPNKTRWLASYPEDPATAVKARLNEYLQLLATVDFNAQLSGQGKKRRFVNAAYEAKPLKWKAIYRAGKAVNDVVSTFAKDWLKEGVIAAGNIKMAEAYPIAAGGGNNTPSSGNPEVKQSKKSLFNSLKEKAKAAIP